MVYKSAMCCDKLSLVMDTDTFNEIDDQFALTYALAHKEIFDLKAVIAAPYCHERVHDPNEGMLKSYDEILNIFDLYGSESKGRVYKGSGRYLLSDKDIVHSQGVEKIIELALKQVDSPLYIVAIGAATNIASAIKLCPEIMKKIVIIWLGGHPYYWPTAKEFNLKQDVIAAQALFDSGINLVHIPCYDVAKLLTTTASELKAGLEGCSRIGDYLERIFCEYLDIHKLTSKTIWDMAPVAYLINQQWVQTEKTTSPILTDDMTWLRRKDRHIITVATGLDKNVIFSDFYRKLRAEKSGECLCESCLQTVG